MEGKFNYGPLRKYPHLLGDDKLIWNSFINLYPDLFTTVDYDVHVGQGKPPAEGTEKNFADQWKQLTMKRIDVIGWKDNQPTIVEVKDVVGLETLGQLLGYSFLYKKENPEIVTLPLICVTSACGPDDMEILKYYKIKVFVI